MRKISLFILMAAIAALFAACGAPADNKPANTNTNANTAKPVAAAPTADALLEMEKKAQDAYIKADGAYFEGMLSDKAMMSMGKDRMDKAGIVQMIKTAKCEDTTTNLSEPQMSKINDDTYAFTYKNASTGKCSEGPNGKMTDLKPTRAATVWVRNGEKWQAVWHGENLIMDPKASPAAPAAKDEAKNEEPKKADVKKEEPKKEEAKKEEPKKEDAKKEEAKKADAVDSAATTVPAKPVADPNTDALVKLHATGWDAFRNKDAKAFESMIAATFSGVAPDGSYLASKADAIKEWTGAGTMKCEGITKTSFTDGFAHAISPTVEILFGKGNADGKCNGQPNGDLWNTAVYVKEGDAWKMAFMFESMGM